LSRSEAVSLPQEIHHYLWNEIAALTLKPGEKLSEARLARQFDCSRIPVREAVQRLNREGALESFPQRGSFVSLIDMQHVREVRYLREVLETRVVLDAYDAGLITPLVPLLRSMLEKQEKAIRYNELEKMTDLDYQFHDLFYHLQKKEFVKDHTGYHDIHYLRARRFALGIERNDKNRLDDSINIVSQHRAIVDAVDTGDRAKLEHELRRHFRNINHTLENGVLQDEIARAMFKLEESN
jgi:DNA-binding GntR family transcriptional regulator